ncbi:hypothetical protein PPERSA_00825 [Pseudocohnilembus persalinus]|uniref:Uncharacterized protein n=1 Tax=Pseudocohnilembus persalinus TaxID=266149 RepID=A0A0V0QM49_PSEPJ|nr:hypothetical protein PPERSA_00825 [Pseudocohnilembus persalinus]|eukprot:KRX03302.1 hypothetical protein PPERSA_00825 [Pseudocohnilembus persalinus]
MSYSQSPQAQAYPNSGSLQQQQPLRENNFIQNQQIIHEHQSSVSPLNQHGIQNNANNYVRDYIQTTQPYQGSGLGGISSIKNEFSGNQIRDKTVVNNLDPSNPKDLQLKNYLTGMEDKVLAQLTLIDTLTLENSKLKTAQSRMEATNDQYKDTLKKMYLKNQEQEKLIEQMRRDYKDRDSDYDKLNNFNQELNNDLKNILVDREILEKRLVEGDKKYDYDIKSLTAQLGDKNEELADMKKKINQVLEIKRRLEEENETLKFSLDNQRQKTEAEIREKQIKLEQLERAFQENMEVKNQEISGYQDKIREAELEIRRLMDQNKNYAHELTVLSKDIRYRDYQSKQMQRSPNKGSGTQFRQTLNQSRQFNNTQGFGSGLVSDEVYENNNQQQQNPLQQQDYQPQNLQENYEYGQGQGFDGNSNQFGGSNLNFQNTGGSQMARMSNNGNRSQIQTKGKSNQAKNSFLESIMDLAEKNQNKRLKQLLMDLWKNKAELKRRDRQNKVLVNLKYGGQGDQGGQGQGSQIKGFEQMSQKNNEVLIQFSSFGDSIIGIMSYTRTNISNLAFEIFGKSIQQANDKQLNALNLFMANMSEIKDKYWKGLILVLEVYSKMRRVLKDLYNYINHKPQYDELHQKVQLSLGKLDKNQADLRNNLNKYLESTIAHTIQKKAIDKLDKNRDFIFLFRLLTIKYRIRYPMRGKEFKVDLDLEIALDHKIAAGLKTLLVQN